MNSQRRRLMSVFAGKADIVRTSVNVRFWWTALALRHQSGIGRLNIHSDAEAISFSRVLD
jgi:hypothetical protein